MLWEASLGRGKGQSLNCWRNSNSDCNYQYSRADQHQYTGLTFRMSNTWINGMTYSSIRFQGTNLVQGNHYWAGKDNTEHPTCTYVHWRVATGNCNCASSSVNMANRRCGRNYGGHFGAGDWPHSSGGMMTGHVSNGWYIFFKFESRVEHPNVSLCATGAANFNLSRDFV